MKLEIEKVVYPGKGLSRTEEGMVVFTPGTLVGETVEVEIVKQHKNFAEAKLLNIVVPSPDRIEPACPLQKCDLEAKCPGCTYQYVKYETEVKFKNEQLIDLLTNMGKVELVDQVKPPVSSPKEYNYRNKILLHRDGEKFGYFSEDNRTLIDVSECLLAKTEINELLKELRERPGFLKENPEKRTVTLRYTETDGAMQWFGRTGSKNRKLKLTEKTNVGKIEMSTGAFFQVNPEVAEVLTSKLITLMQEIKPTYCVDLYCGVGVHAFAASKAGVPNVLGIEIDENAIKAGKQFARENGMRITLLAGAVEKLVEEALKVTSAPETTVIVDPPRRGLEDKVIKSLGNNIPRYIVYISCSPDTLSRDIKKLAKFGYELKSAQLLDMFPRTPYFETLVLLEKDYNKLAEE
ncbi:MAG: TRAM domain-containing protein [Kiritimatiellae bacterium]|jgi:tRNA/tmRNA/rRNA uracil-C5-methylase (TrmA/RlmC/RlmD family)|nr:TRAM domain-containing protein [Kiritimatiellia bacterium]